MKKSGFTSNSIPLCLCNSQEWVLYMLSEGEMGEVLNGDLQEKRPLSDLIEWHQGAIET